jgi:hypothetical protein
MVQVPVATKVTVFPATVQTDVIKLLKDTASPEDAVALTVNGASAMVLSARVPNVIVWSAFCAVVLLVTSVAAP